MGEEALLAQVRVLADKHEALAAASGESFNLFEILGRETDEVHTHSAILAELLDPNGSHRQGAVFARLFAERIKIGTEGIGSARVSTEQTVAKGSRADILIQTHDTCVVVENKIHARDQPGQLKRYHAYAAQSRCHKVIYLTLHGDPPGEDSLGNLPPDEVELMSYEEGVLGWIDDCIKEVARVPHIREILAHYQALLRKLTGKSTGELVMELKELLGKEQGDGYNFDVVPKIAEAMTALSVETEWKFWQTLKSSLEDGGDRPWRLEALDGPEAAALFKEATEDAIGNAHGAGRNKWGYGWTFRILPSTDQTRYRDGRREVLLRVEYDSGGWGLYGFVAVEWTTEGHRLSRAGDASLFEDRGEWVSRLGDGWRTGGGPWIAWKWPAEDVCLVKTTGWLAPEGIRRLREGEVVDPLVGEIQAAIDKAREVGKDEV